MSTLVLGIGNTLLADEGIGVHAARYLCQHHSDFDNVQFMDGGTLSFTLVGPIENCSRLIVIDAAQLNQKPGTVCTYLDTQMDYYLHNQNHRSVHEVGLMDILSIVRLTQRLPGQRALIGVQPRSVSWGDKPSSEVHAAIPEICNRVIKLLHEWQS